MPTIPGFPRQLLEEHRAWHHARMTVDSANPPPGFGADFLAFHRRFIRRALDWYRSQGLDERLVQPWTVPPEPIRSSACYDRAAEARILRMPRSFATADELGRFIEASGLHNCMHQQAALLYGEPDLNDFDVAPRSTVFYQIHGMIDNWYRAWEEALGITGGPARVAASGGGTRRAAAGGAAGARGRKRSDGGAGGQVRDGRDRRSNRRKTSR